MNNSNTHDQRIAKLATDGIVADDVILQQHTLLGAADRFQPRGVVRGRVDQQVHRIAAEQGRAGGTAERLLGQQAAGRG